MSIPPLSALSDPSALAKLQILVVPIQPSSRDAPRLSEAIYSHWSGLIKRHQAIRRDDIRSSSSVASSSGHTRGSSHAGPSSRTRFIPASSAASVSKANTNQYVQLAYPLHPPARHLYPLNLLRLAAFPLVVIGITVGEGDGVEETPKGFSLKEEDESGDVGGTTPTTSTFSRTPRQNDPTPSQDFEETVSGLFPESSAFPLIKRLVVVPPDLPRSPDPNPSPRKGGYRETSRPDKGKGKEEVRYAPNEGTEGWIGRLLGEVIGDVFGELGELVTALETPTGLKTLSSTLLPSLTSTSHHMTHSDLFPIRSTTPGDMPSRPGTSTPTLNHSQSTDTLSLSGAMGITLNRALTPGGRPTSVQPTSIQPIPSQIAPEPKPVAASNPTRRFSAIPSPFTRTSSAASTTSNVSAGGAQSPAIATSYTSASLTGVAGGRLMKILGDVYLIVGLYGDAIKCYDDGAERCRVTGDVLWEAMAREGRAVAAIGEAWETRDGSDRSQPFSSSPIPVEIVAHYLSALSCLSRAPLPYPPTILSPLPHAVSGSLSLPAPSHPSQFHSGTGEGLLAYLYTSLSLRIAHFHLIIWSAGGWGSIALSCLVSHTLPRTFPPPLDELTQADPFARRRRHRFFSLLSNRSGLTRTSVLAHGEGAVGPYHRSMSKTEQVAALTEVTWLARWLDMPRHEAIYSREVARRLGRMIVEGKEESRRIARAGFGKGPEVNSAANAAVGLGLGMTVQTKEVVTRRRETTEGNSAIMVLIERILSILNIDLLSPLSAHIPPTPSTQDTPKPPRFGWPEIQVDTLQSMVAVAENLSEQEMLTRLALSALKGLGSYLHQGSQAHLVRLVNNATNTLKRRGRWKGGVEWWIPGKVVLSLEVAALPSNRFPVEHAASEIVEQGKRDPFLYNPRVKAVEAGKTVIVANEQIDVFVTVSNPFAFDLEVADLSLITSGAQFIANPLPLVLPANSVQTVRVTGLAPSPGILHIQGVSIRLPDGASTKVYLPVIDEKARLRKEKRRSRAMGEMGKMKRMGMEARHGENKAVGSADETVRTEHRAQEGELEEGERWLECRVVQELPLLWVKRSNLSHGTMMLYNGESTILRLTLENSSSTPVNFLELSFDDNTLREARTLLNEEIAPQDVYEVEHDLIKRPVFTYDGAEADIDIPAGGRYTVAVKCFGKIGCTDGSIRIDYGFIDRSTSHDSAAPSFHTRQITFPILFTVYHTLELHDLDIIRFPANPEASMPNGDALHPSSSATLRHQQKLQSAFKHEADGKHCLVALGVRNVFGVPFEVSLSRIETETPDSEDDLVNTRLVPPGASERLILPFPRTSLPDDITSAPIPSLTSRQYIIDKTGRSASQLQQDRESFWHREHLLKHLRLHWSEPGTRRNGEMSLRNQALEQGMLEVLRVDLVEVRVQVPKSKEGSRAGDFIDIVAEVVNRLGKRLECEIRLEAITPRHIIFDGAMSSSLSVDSEQTGSHRVSALCLAEGTFAFRAVVVESSAGAGRVWASEILRMQIA